MPGVVAASHVSFTVTDLDRSVAWYRAVFGAEITMQEPGDERQAVVMSLPGTSLAIGLVHFAAGSGDRFDPGRTGLDHFAFQVDSEESMQQWVVHLDALGVEHSGAIAIPVGAILNLKDPDGIALALMWRPMMP